MKGFVVIVALVAVVAAQKTSEETTGTDYQAQPDLSSLGAAIEAQVYQEASLARAFLPNVLALQRAQHTMLAGQAYLQMLHLQHEEDSARDGKHHADFEEDEDEEYGYLFTEPDGYSETDAKQVKLNLYASYYLYSAIKIKFLETLISAPDVQNAFWADRGFTYFTQSSAGQLPAEILQLLFLSQYKTSLETMKLSLALQMISHFSMWLEDEIDVSGALVDSLNPYSKDVLRDQSDDIVRDKLFAFSAYNTYAMVDLQIFYLETYLSAAMGQAGSLGSLGASAPAATQAQPTEVPEAASLLEEESQPVGNKFMPLLFASGQDPATIFQLYRVYFLLAQVSGAQAAYTSAFAEQLAIEKEAKGDAKEAQENIKFARQLFGGSFAFSLVQASQIEYQQALLKLFILFSDSTGSATGGSLGAGATAAAATSLGAGAAASSFAPAQGAGSLGSAATLGSFGPAAAALAFGPLAGLGSFGPGVGSFGPAAALGSLGAASAGSFGPGLGSFGPAAALGSLGAASLGSFGPALGPAAALGSLGAASLGSFGPTAGSFGPAAGLGSLGAAAALGSFGPAAGLGSFGPGLGSLGPAAALGSFGPAAGLGSFGPAAALGSFGPAAGLGSFGPAAALGSFGPAAGLGSFGPAAALGSLGPAAGLGSFGPAAALGSFGPATGFGSLGPAAALGSLGAATFA